MSIAKYSLLPLVRQEADRKALGAGRFTGDDQVTIVLGCRQRFPSHVLAVSFKGVEIEDGMLGASSRFGEAYGLPQG